MDPEWSFATHTDARGDSATTMPNNPFRPHVKPGDDPARSLSAAEYNRRNAEIEELARLSVAAASGEGSAGGSFGLQVFYTPAGRSLGTTSSRGFYARLANGPAGNSNPYGFAEVIPDGQGGWVTVPGGMVGKGQSATDSSDLSAYEVNGVKNLAGRVIHIRPGAPGDYRGQWVAKATSGGTTPPPTVTPPNCFCAVPISLQMHSDYPECNYQMFQSCGIAYGPPPADLQDAGYTANAFVSTSTFVDPVSGADFYYYFYCRLNQFFLTRIFPHFPDGTPDGSAYRDGTLYSWIVGGAGNQCSPFQLTNGKPFPGSDASCAVQIRG